MRLTRRRPFRGLSPAYRRLFAQGGAGHDLGRYRRALSLLRPAGRQSDPLRRGGRGGGDGLLRCCQGWPMTEWPDWIPTPEIQARLGPYPARVPGGPANPLGARALYLYEGNKDTLYRIHGTNQPEYIGQAISSGCIRMTRYRCATDITILRNRSSPAFPRSHSNPPARLHHAKDTTELSTSKCPL